MTHPAIHFAIGAFPPSLGGAQIHTAALVDELRSHYGSPVRVSCLWRTTRQDFLLGSTVRLASGLTRKTTNGLVIDEVGLEGGVRPFDLVATAAYYAARSRAARYFAGRLDFDDGTEPISHIVRLGREHLALRAFLGARRQGRSVVLTPNHHPRWSHRPDPVWNKLYREVDHVFALTESEKSALVTLGVSPGRISVTGIGPVVSSERMSRSDFRASFSLPDARFIGFLGQQFAYKRVDVVIEAFDELAGRDRDLILLIAGPTAQTTEKLRGKARYKDRIVILGPLSLAHKTAFLEHIDVLLFPSSQESFGGVLVEAAWMGTPFVTSQIPALAEVTANLKYGESVPPTAGAVAAATEQLLEGGNSYADLASEVRRRIQERYAWEALASRYMTVYEDLS